METSFTIRPMVETDVSDVFHIESYENPHSWTEQIFLDCLKVKYPCFVMLDPAQQIIGFGILSLAVDETHLLNISIAHQYRRRGLGQSFLDYLLEVSKQLGAKQMLLEVRRSNKGAASLYLKNGFKQIGFRKDYYRTEGGREDALVLRKVC